MRYWPLASVIDERTFSMRASLAASTVTPGSTAPDVSLTTPAMDDCASATVGMNRIPARTSASLVAFRTTLLLVCMTPPWMARTGEVAPTQSTGGYRRERFERLERSERSER